MHHVVDLEVFDHNEVIVVDQLSTQLMGSIPALVLRFAVQAGNCLHLESPTFRATLLSI
jgi:hypothetical protein